MGEPAFTLIGFLRYGFEEEDGPVIGTGVCLSLKPLPVSFLIYTLHLLMGDA